MRLVSLNRYLDMGVSHTPHLHASAIIRKSNGLALLSACCTGIGGVVGLASWGNLLMLLWGLGFALLFLFTPLLNFRYRHNAAKALLQIATLVSIVSFHILFVINPANSGIRTLLFTAIAIPLLVLDRRGNQFPIAFCVVALVIMLAQPYWHSLFYLPASRTIQDAGLFDYCSFMLAAGVVAGGYLLLWRRSMRAEQELFQATETRKKTTLQFVTITNTLSQQREETRQKSERIEQLAAELAGKNEQLNGTLQKLKDAQQLLIVTEKMASLGNLISNVAHEINTPIGVIRASATNLETLASSFLSEIPQRIRAFTDQQNNLFEKLLNTSSENEFSRMSTREQRDLKRHLQSELELAQIKQASDIATLLIQCEIVKVSPFLTDLQQASGKEVLEIAAGFKQVRSAASVILRSTDKTRRVVFALRAFLNTDDLGHTQRVKIKTNIEHVLENYALLFKVGIKLVTIWEASPTILGDEEELIQVWTNLIYNALQAMHGRGTLTIKLHVLNGTAIVEIADTGEGIPLEIAPRLFEPFFTTKESGEGIGLGLFQTKRIVERHRGSLSFTSAPGSTQFTVSLPLAE